MSDRAAERERNPGEKQPERGAESGERLVDQDSPAKRHGDALQDGSGNRHGVHQRGEEPDTCA